MKKLKKCDQKMEVYSRICGYYRPTIFWNKGKLEEFRQRQDAISRGKLFRREKEKTTKTEKRKQV